MTGAIPARVWPDDFDGEPVAALVTLNPPSSLGPIGRAFIASGSLALNHQVRIAGGRDLTIDFGGEAWVARPLGTQMQGPAGRWIFVVAFGAIRSLPPPPPWPDRRPDDRPDCLIPEDFYA